MAAEQIGGQTPDGVTIVGNGANSGTGVRVGSAATDKVGFWGKTPAIQPTVLTTFTSGATTTAQAAIIVDMQTKLTTIGIFAAS